MTETTVQAGIQATLQAMSEFADADVVINDWTVLDQSSANAPYVIIENSDIWESTQSSPEPVTVWSIPINLVVKFTDWKASLNSFRTLRQAIVDKFNSSDERSAGGLEAVDIRRIYGDAPIGEIYDRYISQETISDALPVFLCQRIIMEIEEF